MNQKILIVEDDPDIVTLMTRCLATVGYRVLVAQTGVEAFEISRTTAINLLILDMLLPNLNKLDIYRLLRVESRLPVILITETILEKDILEEMMSEYLSKSFTPEELLAKVHKLLWRHAHAESQQEIEYQGLVVNFFGHEVKVKGNPVQLTPKEFKLLETFVKQPGRVFTRMELVEKVFGMDYAGLERTVDVHLMHLRHKIEPNLNQPTYIQTVYGVGYKFACD
jgi:DNA-binding response OmpR family regulator